MEIRGIQFYSDWKIRTYCVANCVRPEPFVRLQPINCFFESINIPEKVSNSFVTLRVNDTTYGISNQLEFIQGGFQRWWSVFSM